jgi:glycosyltransferase involved in cell wall biosynthesis
MSDRVAIICGGGIVSGKEIMALELGTGLRDHGMCVEFVSAFWGTPEFRERLAHLGIKNHVMRLGFISATLTPSAIRMTLHQLLHVPGLLVSYARFLRSFRPQRVVHTNWHHALLLLPFLKQDRDVYWSHEIVPNNSRLQAVFRAIDRRVGRFVAVSEATAASLQRARVPSEKIHVIYNGIEPPKTSRPAYARTDTIVVGIAGQIGAWKGHEDLIAAFAIAVTAFPQIRLSIFGAGSDDYESHLRRRVDELGLSSVVNWHGFVRNRDEIYRQMDICVVPSRVDDPLPTSAIEALLYGIPVVATRRGGLPEIVEEGITGLLFDDGDIRQLASCLAKLVSDPELAHEMGQRAASRAAEKFDRGRFIRDFSAVLADSSVCTR